jgi:hypothetical protein
MLSGPSAGQKMAMFLTDEKNETVGFDNRPW